MSFSLDVLILNQKESKKFADTNSFSVKPHFEPTKEDLEKLKIEYGANFIIPEIQRNYFYDIICGTWYSLDTYEDIIFDSFDMIDTDFDHSLAVNASWLIPEDKECFTPLVVKKEFQQDLENLLTEMIQSSPTKSLVIYPRYQSRDNEVVQGVIPFDQFLKLLKEEKIPFNVYTIVQDITTL